MIPAGPEQERIADAAADLLTGCFGFSGSDDPHIEMRCAVSIAVQALQAAVDKVDSSAEGAEDAVIGIGAGAGAVVGKISDPEGATYAVRLIEQGFAWGRGSTSAFFSPKGTA